MSSLTTTRAPKGLEGVVATTSSICYIDGEQGVLAYRGIDIHELADNSTFEETCYLLWFGRLPRRNELKKLRDRLAEVSWMPRLSICCAWHPSMPCRWTYCGRRFPHLASMIPKKKATIAKPTCTKQSG